jgi:hypothetical protein
MDEPLMLLPILDVEPDLKRRGLPRRDENALQLLDHVPDPLHLRVWSLESDDDRLVVIIVGDVGQNLPLVREPVAQVAPDDLDRRLDDAEHVGQLLKVRAPRLTWDLLRGDCHHPSG